jgi:carbon monoxide dehydrogenase subunit G
MPSFHETVEIEASPEATWSVLGDLAGVDRWIPGIASVEIDGASRVCTFEDGRVQHEQISDYSPERRSYRYTIDGGLPARDNGGRFAVEARPGGSRVIWESSFEPLEPASETQLTEMWQAAIPVVLGNLKRLVEDAAA